MEDGERCDVLHVAPMRIGAREMTDQRAVWLAVAVHRSSGRCEMNGSGACRRHQHGERIIVHEARDRRAIIDGEVVGQVDAHGEKMSWSMPGAGGFRHEQRPRLGRLERIAAVAELAGHFDVAALGQDRLDLGGARDPQRVFDSLRANMSRRTTRASL